MKGNRRESEASSVGAKMPLFEILRERGSEGPFGLSQCCWCFIAGLDSTEGDIYVPVSP